MLSCPNICNLRCDYYTPTKYTKQWQLPQSFGILPLPKTSKSSQQELIQSSWTHPTLTQDIKVFHKRSVIEQCKNRSGVDSELAPYITHTHTRRNSLMLPLNLATCIMWLVTGLVSQPICGFQAFSSWVFKRIPLSILQSKQYTLLSLCSFFDVYCPCN